MHCALLSLSYYLTSFALLARIPSSTSTSMASTDSAQVHGCRMARRHRHHQGTRSVPVSPSGFLRSASVVRGDVRVHPTPPSVGEAKIDIHPADTLLAQMLRQQARFHSTRSRP